MNSGNLGLWKPKVNNNLKGSNSQTIAALNIYPGNYVIVCGVPVPEEFRIF